MAVQVSFNYHFLACTCSITGMIVKVSNFSTLEFYSSSLHFWQTRFHRLATVTYILEFLWEITSFVNLLRVINMACNAYFVCSRPWLQLTALLYMKLIKYIVNQFSFLYILYTLQKRQILLLAYISIFHEMEN